MRRLAALALLTLVASCAERVRVQTYPAGASVTMNGIFMGTAPVVASIPRSAWTGGPVPYRIEKEGYEPAEGAFELCTLGGRVTGGVFTFGLSLLLKPPRSFCSDPVVVHLTPRTFEAYGAVR